MNMIQDPEPTVDQLNRKLELHKMLDRQSTALGEAIRRGIELAKDNKAQEEIQK